MKTYFVKESRKIHLTKRWLLILILPKLFPVDHKSSRKFSFFKSVNWDKSHCYRKAPYPALDG